MNGQGLAKDLIGDKEVAAQPAPRAGGTDPHCQK